MSLSVQDEGRKSAKYGLFFTLVWKTHWKIVGFNVEFFDVYDKCARMNDTKIHDLPSRSIPAPPPLRPRSFESLQLQTANLGKQTLQDKGTDVIEENPIFTFA